MATASPFDASLGDIVDRLYAATSHLTANENVDEVAQQSVALALGLTRSSCAVIGLGDLGGGFQRFYSQAKGSPALGEEATQELLQAAGFLPVGARAGRPSGRHRHAPAIGAELKAGGQSLGVLVVGRDEEYAETEKRLLAIFAGHVASALEMASLRQRQHELESTLIELRARIDRQAAQQTATAERLRTADRVERAHEQAVQVLDAVSSLATSGESLADFNVRLAATVGKLVGADKVLFWRLREDGTVAPVRDGYGLSDSFLARLVPTRCEPTGSDLASRVVFKDLIFRANRGDEAAEFEFVLERLGVASAISVPWRAGNERLGLLAAYDSTRPGGFSREDTWVLQKAGLAAGIVTQLWHAQESLRKSVERLTKVDAARQLLLRNMTTVVEKERRRFVSELHDDALQKLTAAEMHAARLAAKTGADAAAHEALARLLADTEAALRRLVFDVHPPALEGPDGLTRSLQDRVAMLKPGGIECKLELDLPEDLSQDTRALIFRQVAEALGNVERHSQATQVAVSLKVVDGGIDVVIIDNGRGFSVAEKSNLPGHLGLQALKERALMAGGRYKIDSRPGEGTRIEFWIPLDR